MMNIYSREQCIAVKDAWKRALYEFLYSAGQRPSGELCWVQHPFLSPGRTRWVTNVVRGTWVEWWSN